MMEKISGILPTSSRINRVDLRQSSPVRPGTPGFGQNSATAALNGNRNAKTTAEKAVHELNKMKAERTARQEKIVNDIADDFFVNHPVPGRGKSPGPSVEETFSMVTPYDSYMGIQDGKRAETTEELSQEIMLAMEPAQAAEEEYMEMPEKGGYLDVVA